jgi:branched-chain amino acid transport system substrate-binding protein
MGFVAAEITVSALRTINGDYTVKSVNQAIKNVKADILCKPWYCGDAPLHIPNNTDWTSTPKTGHMVIKEQCFGISDVDPAIAQVRKLEKQGA